MRLKTNAQNCNLELLDFNSYSIALGFEGEKCDRCSNGHYNFPNCWPCNCDAKGTKASTCQGSSCSCDNKRTGSYCDSANSQCKCGKDTDSCQQGETCVDGACIRCIGGDSCCTKDKPCGLGEGDCDYDSDCKNDLKCGKDNCKKCEKGTDCGLFDDTDDCCIQP